MADWKEGCLGRMLQTKGSRDIVQVVRTRRTIGSGGLLLKADGHSAKVDRAGAKVREQQGQFLRRRNSLVTRDRRRRWQILKSGDSVRIASIQAGGAEEV